MHQDRSNQAVVHMLPPSFAVYLKGALLIPVLVKPGQGSVPAEVYVSPVVLASNVVRIQWCLVLLSGDPAERVEFALPGAIVFTQTSGEVARILGFPQGMSTTQIAVDVEEAALPSQISRATYQYDLYFRLLRGPSGPSGPVIRATVADPSVAVTPDPVDIPTWP